MLKPRSEPITIPAITPPLRLFAFDLSVMSWFSFESFYAFVLFGTALVVVVFFAVELVDIGIKLFTHVVLIVINPRLFINPLLCVPQKPIKILSDVNETLDLE